ncbi:Uncharacterised protein [Salmonella enterica subsp. enterica serovar Typhi]|nr:Uncharacterised protein [Salmonella enterica subsp. enterica serovar Typhi]CEV33163.1 Uncharacterised protein [Salmonella enterica subsp. enterica serovar Typhi]CFZ48102.1 Uncharacterised protein [Salmonella enterica subsp. enterica serovar Typhi]CGW15068.1 Uncharacterised protein [Salmonella enterica subsp. enterica serovar Typhi]CGY16188.1 Uncharacterised protein [Salmonella enterica subsp. enterica serovar Typhi]
MTVDGVAGVLADVVVVVVTAVEALDFGTLVTVCCGVDFSEPVC